MTNKYLKLGFIRDDIDIVTSDLQNIVSFSEKYIQGELVLHLIL